ncbi:MAG: hypothetical protein COW76_00130, partial [Shewanella sp. CG18_big_fil_WC_8_21_14_2_50_42_11]
MWVCYTASVPKLSKDFTNAAHLRQQKEQGVQRRLVGFEMAEQGIPRAHYEIVNETGET